ncbi:carboxypeptidase regulatory-like domain-containing protein [Nocardioides nitrophenolicus]|uniref:carboxypeptidase regulatory-like domain-containing protein n=1 Tax=Nocardioides nitrophenolicus TaxID=60489 RepID=UPI00195BB259|nr:carboxypeptidase regulatory-like domain-containing protein [Nocardioides nitrophenolicus]MBM7517930.1 putative RNA-binding protein with TRAM domain [Nocardioides nitrophenolicus]
MRTQNRGPVVRLLTAVVTTALALMGLVALTTAAAPVAHAAAGSISGTVSAAGTGTPLAGITVVAYCNDDGDWYWCEQTTSGANGGYAFTLPAGTYHVGAFSEDNRYAAAFFGGTDEVNAANLTPPVSDVDLVLTPNATVKGKVGQGLLNTGVADVDVCLYQQVSHDGETWWDCAGRAVTGSNGTYTAYVAPGSYRVGFSVGDNHLRDVYYPNAATLETATDVSVTAAGRTGINVKMVPNAKVTGTVTAETGGAAVAGAQVTAYRLVQEGGASSWEPVRSTAANGSGGYELYLAPGSYRIGFDNPCDAEGPCSTRYRPEFWNDKVSVESATDVSVPNSGSVAGISATLKRNARITGTVTAQAGGAPIDGAEVTALRQVTEQIDGETHTYWDQIAWASTDATGGYDLFVPTGSYRVSFDDGCADTCEDLYQTEYWNDAADLESADDIAVTAPASQLGIDAALARNGRITGTVTAENGGAALADIQVVALDEVTYQAGGETYTDWSPVGFATTDADGDYTLNAPPGTHRVGFFEPCWGATCRYLAEYYDDAATPEQGTDVTVTGPDATTPDVDAALAEGSLLSGKLTGTAQAPVADALVSVYAEDGGAWTELSETWSDSRGRYAALVPDGSYRIGFSSPDGAFTEEYYDDSRTLADADTVVVAGANRPNLDATLGLELRNTATPSIPDADPQVGETVSADPGSWSATPDAFSYRWFETGNAIPIGTTKDLVVPASALGKQLTVVVTATKAGYADGVATSTASAAVTHGVLTSTAKPSISGAATVGSTLTALEGTWSATPDAYTYAWYQSGTSTPIGAGKVFVVPPGALGTTLTVKVSAAKAGHTGAAATSDPTATVAPGGLANTARPAITGAVEVGGTVTASGDTWSHNPDPGAGGRTYRWFQEGTATPIGTGSTLVVPASALGKKLTVEVTATATGYGTSSAVSDPTAAVATGTFAHSVAPTISGAAKVGGTVTAVEGTWSPTPAGYAYRWFQDGTLIADATGKTLVVPAGALGKPLTVEVTATAPGYQSSAVVSAPTGPVALGDLTSEQAPRVNGSPQVGKTVSAGPGTWSATPSGYAYRWFQEGTATPIGTGQDLVVPPGAAGKTLSVEVTATASAYHDGVATSAPSAPVALGDLANTDAPTVTGTAKVGRTVTAGDGTWSAGPATYSYQWFQDGTAIEGATAKDLVVPGGARGKKLTVEVTATVPGYAPSSVESAETATVTVGDAPANTAPPTITGDHIEVGRTVTALPGTWSPAPDGYQYRWYLNGTNDPIGTGADLVIPSSAGGRSLTVKVTAVKDGYADGTAVSEAVAVVAPAIVNTVKPAITGPVRVGETLTVGTGSWSSTPSAFGYTWYANGVQIKGVTGNRLTLTPDLAGKVIAALVVAAPSGAAWADSTAPVALGVLKVSGKPTLSGTAKVGKKLKVVLPAAVPAGATVKVQWLVGKRPVPGATKKGLKLTKAFRGTKVRAVVTWSLPGYAPVTLKTAKVTIR